jgi:nucleoside-diphosphate-sugar epimerase
VRVLVTGGAGFIGAAVCERLLARGETVVCVDSLNDAYDVRLKDWRLARLLGRPGFTFVKADVADVEAVAQIFATARIDGGFDAVVNLAARAGIRPSVEIPRVYYETNVLGTLALLDACRAHGVGRLILASSSSVYGDSTRTPFREDAPLGNLLSPYAASKLAAEEVCRVYGRLHGIRSTVLRFFTVFGPAGRPDMSPFLFTQWAFEGRPIRIYGDGSQTRDFTYVDDIADGTLAALDRGGEGPYNLGNDHPVKLLDFLGVVAKAAGREVKVEHLPPSPADVPATWADISRARAELGWAPRVSCEEGVARLAEWYAANRHWVAEVPTR